MTTNDLTLEYHYNTDPHRGLAATGTVFLKFLLALPHTIVVGVLQNLAFIIAYIGYWAVAFTGRMPGAVHEFTSMSLGWTARQWAWIAGVSDIYPPFETDPVYPVSFRVDAPEEPNRGWAVAGLAMVKFLAAIPHLIVMAFLALGALVAMWIGYFIVLFTGEYPTALQDFLAGVLQWWLRVAAWLYGLTDEYPPFSLDAHPAA